jgi:taurine dioxygenase
MSYNEVPPDASVLYGIEVPEGHGDTWFCDMEAALAALPAALRRRIAGLGCKHDSSRNSAGELRAGFQESYAPEAQPGAVHPLVRTHPETGRKSLYLNPNRMEEIAGLERAESDRLLDELIAHATQMQYQYRHVWRQGDIVIRDNRCTMHKANADYPEGEQRLMHRVIVAGTVPV